ASPNGARQAPPLLLLDVRGPRAVLRARDGPADCPRRLPRPPDARPELLGPQLRRIRRLRQLRERPRPAGDDRPTELQSDIRLYGGVARGTRGRIRRRVPGRAIPPRHADRQPPVDRDSPP